MSMLPVDPLDVPPAEVKSSRVVQQSAALSRVARCDQAFRRAEKAERTARGTAPGQAANGPGARHLFGAMGSLVLAAASLT
jgi:hypothetical protein